MIKKLVLHMVYVACKNWTGDDNEIFVKMIESAISFDKKLKNKIKLMEIECYAHHLEDSEYLGIKPLELFIELYSNQKSKLPQKGKNLKIQAEILMDIHLYFSSLSPLTTCKLSEYHNEVIPKDDYHLKSIKNDEDQERTLILNDLLSIQNRMKRLKELYVELPNSYLKAKAAFVLGKSDEQIKNFKEAESKYFEGVFILFNLPDFLGNFFIASELGCNLFECFGSILLNQSNYKYSIEIYECCSLSYKLLGDYVSYFNLLSKLAPIATTHFDFKRALIYYKHLLYNYIYSKKINEVSALLSSLLPSLFSLLPFPTSFLFPSIILALESSQ